MCLSGRCSKCSEERFEARLQERKAASVMTPHRKALARHALGLPNAGMKSYRNRFVAADVPGGDRDHWCALAAGGLAGMGRLSHDGMSRGFWLTRKGAELALEPGERLDPEDFHEAGAGT